MVRRILVIDKDQVAGSHTAQLLRQQGANPIAAPRLSAGLARAGDTPIDLVITSAGALSGEHAASLIHSPLASDLRAAVARLERLFELSLLRSDVEAAFETLAAGVASVFGVHNCIIWGPPDETGWPRCAHPIADSAAALLADTCQAALAAECTAIDARAEYSVVAAPLAPPDGSATLGTICLVADVVCSFSPQERAALVQLATRLSLELSWISAHHRLLSEHEELQDASLVDALMGIPTRSAVEQAMTQEISAARRRKSQLAVALLNVDHLRETNERFGHVAGDNLLAHFARTIRANLRSEDIVGRVGGDEIAVLFSGLGVDAAQTVLNKLLRTVIDSPAHFGAEQLVVSFTAGISGVRVDEATAEAALGRAHRYMRRAKRAKIPVLIADVGTAAVGVSDDDVVEDMGLRAGTTLGGMYRVLHELSRGAMGVVYRGEDLGLGRPVAIKLLRFDLAQDRDLVARFRDEAAMLASLRHRNLVQVYAFAAEGDEVYFVMELVEGQSLSHVLGQLRGEDEHLSLDAMVQIVFEIADALEAMHAVGLIHRDVKPANILLDQINDRAVLVDVGVAKRREERGDAAGTPGFAAPESFTEASETPATDVYGLAATVYLMLTHRKPFGSGDIMSVIERQLYEPPDPPSKHHPGLSSALDQIVLKALSPKIKDRYGSAAAFAVALDLAVRRANDGSAEAPPRPTRPPADAPRVPTAPTLLANAAMVLPGMGSATNEQAQVRGAVFRVAAKLIEHHLGSPWCRRVIEADDELRVVLDPRLRTSSWQPHERFVTLLRRASESFANPAQLTRALGRTTMSATLPRLFGADPKTLSPQALLKAAESYWSRYFTWGDIQVQQTAPSEVVIRISGDSSDVLVCEVVSGAFERIAELSGATCVKVDHSACVHRGDATCQYHVTWSAGPARKT